jgi:hypothetical protein
MNKPNSIDDFDTIIRDLALNYGVQDPRAVHVYDRAKAQLKALILSELPEKRVKTQDYDGDEDEGGRPFCSTCGQYNDGEEMPELCYCDNYNQALDETRGILDNLFGLEEDSDEK